MRPVGLLICLTTGMALASCRYYARITDGATR